MIVLVPLWVKKTRINIIPDHDVEDEDGVDDDAKNKATK